MTKRRLKVLIVEDEVFIALDAQDVVEMCGHDVVGIAVSAVQAIAYAEREKPDLVLMDIRLSGDIDGIETAGRIRGQLGIDSVFVTANTDRTTRQRAEAVAPLAILQKPLDTARLRELLDRLASVGAGSGSQDG